MCSERSLTIIGVDHILEGEVGFLIERESGNMVVGLLEYRVCG